MAPPESVNKDQRAACYKARDEFYACIRRARGSGSDEESCAALRKAYEGSCPTAWVSHFDKKEVYTAFKQRLQDGEYQNLSTITKS